MCPALRVNNDQVFPVQQDSVVTMRSEYLYAWCFV